MPMCKNIDVYSKKNISYEPIYKYGKLIGNDYILKNYQEPFFKSKKKREVEEARRKKKLEKKLQKSNVLCRIMK